MQYAITIHWCVITGGECVRLFTVLPNKRHILTSDRNDKVTLWDVFTVEWSVAMVLRTMRLYNIGQQG